MSLTFSAGIADEMSVKPTTSEKYMVIASFRSGGTFSPRISASPTCRGKRLRITLSEPWCVASADSLLHALVRRCRREGVSMVSGAAMAADVTTRTSILDSRL